MENLTDKDIRGELIARYLDAETDAREEMLLAEYFAEHAPEADEAAVARLVLAEHPEAPLAAGERAFALHPSTSGRRM
ncbi:MAG: trigger factor, partial [Bacteroidales bacterium]|nr:trigger factor [Bacteroidales bacterium]